MKYKLLIIAIVSAILVTAFAQKYSLPDGFVYVEDVIPDLDVELRYYSAHNFVGDTIDGYHANRLILTAQTANQLKKVQEALQLQNLCLKVYDGYRPQRSVNHFVRWAKDLNDTINKHQFYPGVKKKNLFKDGYIASKSGHSRGSTVDLTIISGKTGKPLDMGSPYDFFGPKSWVASNDITEEQKANRALLQSVMLKYNFRNYSKEWWHFTLRWEPFPKTYFDFEVE